MTEYKLEKDPIALEFCDDCREYALELIRYVRDLENAQIVAKEALETIELANQKLTKERNDAFDKIHRLTDQLQGKTVGTIKERMAELDNAHQRFVNRGKLAS